MQHLFFHWISSPHEVLCTEHEPKDETLFYQNQINFIDLTEKWIKILYTVHTNRSVSYIKLILWTQTKKKGTTTIEISKNENEQIKPKWNQAITALHVVFLLENDVVVGSFFISSTLVRFAWESHFNYIGYVEVLIFWHQNEHVWYAYHAHHRWYGVFAPQWVNSSISSHVDNFINWFQSRDEKLEKTQQQQHGYIVNGAVKWFSALLE